MLEPRSPLAESVDIARFAAQRANVTFATSGGRMRGGIAFVPLAAACAFASIASGTPPGSNGAIAFARYDDVLRTTGALFTVTPDGRVQRRLTTPPPGAVDQHPDWSKTGSRVVFERCANVGTVREACAVGVVGWKGGSVKLFQPRCGEPGRQHACPLVRGPAFTSTGAVVVGLGWGNLLFQPPDISCECVDNQREHSALVLLNADGSAGRAIHSVDGWRATLNRPQVSPDGRRLVFEQRNSWRSRPRGGSALFVMEMKGTGLRQLTPWRLAAGDGPDWSPDGRRILFRAPRLQDFAGSNIYTVGADGRNVRQVTHYHAPIEVLSASFAPDGKWIVFSRTGQGGQPDLFIIRPDGTRLRQVTRTPQWDSAPDWGTG